MIKFIMSIILFIILLTITLPNFPPFHAQEIAKSDYEYIGSASKSDIIGDLSTLYHPPEESIGESVKVDIYTQSESLFHEDNLNYRENVNTISFKGELIDYNDLDNIVFVGDKIKNDYNLKSGDKINIDDIYFTIIDNKSNCNNFTDNYCIEILENSNTTSTKNVII